MQSKLTIFYTDDDPDDLEFFEDIIGMIDDKYTVVTYSNGEELLDALHNPPPTPYVIFLDINMPGMNGLETLKKMREHNNFRQFPVIMFSTSSDESTIMKSREIGANLYVPKSGVFDHLKKSIEHVLRINWKNFIPTDHSFIYKLQ